jgi:hypothetical protein
MASAKNARSQPSLNRVAPDLNKPAILSSRVRMPCTLPRLSVIGTHVAMSTATPGPSTTTLYPLTSWIALRRSGELLFTIVSTMPKL